MSRPFVLVKNQHGLQVKVEARKADHLAANLLDMEERAYDVNVWLDQAPIDAEIVEYSPKSHEYGLIFYKYIDGIKHMHTVKGWENTYGE